MGPRPFSRGNQPAALATVERLRASMGPRPFSRGNMAYPVPLCSSRLLLQWGHGLSAVETPRWPALRGNRGPRFNGATAFQPWKRRGSIGPGGRQRGFNGATAFQPWKPPQGKTRPACTSRASMGPRPFSRGNAADPRVRLLRLARLQWGHGLSAVETLTLVGEPGWGDPASM